jgi:glycerol-3-phosphate acyltransferase PlsY
MTILLIVAYILGSVNSAVIVCKLLNLPSPQQTGSKNPGTTNVLRIGGKKAAAFTFVGDIMKGIIPVLIGHFFNLSIADLCWVGFAAVLGHIYPIFFKFKGGKGVATALGMSIALAPLLGISLMVTWLLIAYTTSYSSLAAIITFTLSPIFASFLLGHAVLMPFTLLALLILLKHKDNIKKLYYGTENKIGTRS